MTNPGVDIPSSSQPVRSTPPRHRWLKRVMLIVGLLLVAAVGLRVWWDLEAKRRLRAKVEQYRATSQPVFVEDFGFVEISEEDNMALPLSEAAEMFAEPDDAPMSLRDLVKYPDLADEHADYVARLIASNDQVFRHMRGAWDRPGVQWDVQNVRPYINITLPHLNFQKNLAQLCYVAAIYHHQRADDKGAVAALEDMLNIATAVSYSWPCLMEHLVAVAISDTCVDAVEQITPGLRVEGALPDGASAKQACTREDVEALIKRLMDEERVQARWRRAMSGERMTCYDTGEFFTDNVGNAIDGFWLIKPALRLDTIKMMEYCTQAQEAGLARDWPTGNTLLPDTEDVSDSEIVTRFLSSLLLPAYDRAVAMHHWYLMRRQLAAAALAIRLYELDHGWRPETLKQLVPDYLPRVPEDRFTTDHRAIEYKPDASPPVLYSIGVNGIDDGGLHSCDDLPRDFEQSGDMVFFLDGDRPVGNPPPESSTQAEDEHVDHNGRDG